MSEPTELSVAGAERSSGLTEERPSLGRRGYGWMWKRNLRTAARNLSALLAVLRLPRALVSSRGHDELLAQYRMSFISTRLGTAAIFLGIATIAWIPIDIVLFEANWDVVLPLIIGRLVAGILFLAIASLPLGGDTPFRGIAAVGLTVGIGIAFFFFAHAVIASGGEPSLRSLGHAQYVLMPIALAAGLAIFPLTLIEVTVLSAALLLTLLAETWHGDGGLIWSQSAVSLALMCSIMITTVTCSVSQLKLLADLYEQSIFDPLTKLLSRRAGAKLLEIMFARSRRSHTSFAVALLDLDRFKLVNDCCGHEAGDQVLQNFARGLKDRLRQEDALIRWGGEEFVLLLADTDAAQAVKLVSELCRGGLGNRPDGSAQKVSVGLSERINDKARNWRELVEIADQRMYLAKKHGGDRLEAPGAVSRRLVGDALTVMTSPSLAPPEPLPGLGRGIERRHAPVEPAAGLASRPRERRPAPRRSV